MGTGLPFLYSLGILHVLPLETAGPADAAAAALLAGAPAARLVLLTTRLLPDSHSPSLRALQVLSAWCGRSRHKRRRIGHAAAGAAYHAACLAQPSVPTLQAFPAGRPFAGP